MTAQIWPFKPRDELIESLTWKTDVFRAKAGEQRSALRSAPRRTFYLDHTFTDLEYSAGRAMVRYAQGADDFLVPDWPQSVTIGAVSPGASVIVAADLTYVDISSAAILWESSTLFEQVEVTVDSSGATLTTVTNTYTSAELIPLWVASAAEGLSASRIGARLNQVSIAMEVHENTDLGATTYAQYRSHDVMPTCPVIGSGNLEESISWPVSTSDNSLGVPHHIRNRDIPDEIQTMRWHEFTEADKYLLRQWMHSRRGRQKAFWSSSYGEDLELAVSVSGTTATVYDLDGIVGLGRSEVFDVEFKSADGTSDYRRVTSTAVGTPIGSRSTLDITLDTSLTLDLVDIDRISFLRCVRFNADRVELQHMAKAGMAVQVPFIEIPVP